jgi:acetyl esterase/lipase
VLAALALAAVAPLAAGNVPDPVTRTNAVRIPSTGTTIGTLTTEVTYDDTTATAAASSGDTVRVNPGSVYLLRTCVAYHLRGALPVSRCAERNVDTRDTKAPISTAVPAVTLPAQPRPTTQPWGHFTPYTEVLSQSAGSWQVIAHSWRDEGLQGAGIPIAAREQTTATLPPNSSVTLDGPFTSAVNSGQPDSICTATPAASDGSPLPEGVTAPHAAFPAAPAYYEVGLPTGAYAGTAPRGVMLVIHGGAWQKTAVGAVQAMRPDADRWRARGWETVNLTYRACGGSFADVLWFYDRARAWFGPDAKICAHGFSAGGTLALLLGASRPGVYCVVSQAGPTDLSRIQDEPAYDAATGLHSQTRGPRWVHNIAAAAFGEENLPSYSPAAQATATLTNSRVLQGFSADDPLVPYRQAADLADAMRAANPAAYVDDLQLAAGPILFGHGRVSQAALDDYYAREERLVAPVTAPTIALDRR